MSARARIYAVVRRIPRGRVATYGQVALVAGLPRRARLVGYALAACEEEDVPWQRVVNAQGRVSGRSEPLFTDRQRVLLEQEGVAFSRSGRIDLERFGWRGPDPEWAKEHDYHPLNIEEKPGQPNLFD